MPRIFGEKIMLREYKKEDLKYMREWVNDPEIVDNLSDLFLHAHSLNETESFLTMVLEGKEQNQKHFVIADKETEEYIGQIDLIKIDWKNRVAEMGIVIGRKDLLGKGFGSEAIRLLQSFVFQQLNLNRLQLFLHDYNIRAQRCYIKCGFIEEGRTRQSFFINGKYTDEIYMAILREEYIKNGIKES
jgi:RimJ/RimL family protein N-acetyltransferase